MTHRNRILAGLLAVTALGGVAIAADTLRGPGGPMRADTNGDGVVSRSEFFTAAETRFKARDANGDRKLSGAEMKDRHGRFARGDSDNDGTLSFEEAAARTSAAFSLLDADRNGTLTPVEVGPRGKHGLRDGFRAQRGPDGRGGPMGGLFGARALERIDANKDGRITRDEMRAQADERFDRLDANKDGAIDQAELRAMRGPGPGPGPGGDMPRQPPAPEDDGD